MGIRLLRAKPEAKTAAQRLVNNRHRLGDRQCGCIWRCWVHLSERQYPSLAHRRRSFACMAINLDPPSNLSISRVSSRILRAIPCDLGVQFCCYIGAGTSRGTNGLNRRSGLEENEKVMSRGGELSGRGEL